jgi:hypothetical protein
VVKVVCVQIGSLATREAVSITGRKNELNHFKSEKERGKATPIPGGSDLLEEEMEKKNGDKGYGERRG